MASSEDRAMENQRVKRRRVESPDPRADDSHGSEHRQKDLNRDSHKDRHKRRSAPSSTSKSRHVHRHERNGTKCHSHSEQRSKAAVSLPSGAPRLHRSHFDKPVFQSLFASYLDIQKNIDVDELDERELKGRWKSFMKKWNEASLAAGWYEPETIRKASVATQAATSPLEPVTGEASLSNARKVEHDDSVSESEQSDFGPTLPSTADSDRDRSRRKLGAPSATFADLAMRDEAARDDERASKKELMHARRTDRQEQRERFDELAPRAEPGTKERQLEKKREAAAANKAYREAGQAGGAVPEVGDAELYGSKDDNEVQRMRQREERKKSDRALKREEALRARQKEREERMEALRQRDEKNMAGLRRLAEERFGKGASSVMH